jgi:hypothetical protein
MEDIYNVSVTADMGGPQGALRNLALVKSRARTPPPDTCP